MSDEQTDDLKPSEASAAIPDAPVPAPTSAVSAAPGGEVILEHKSGIRKYHPHTGDLPRCITDEGVRYERGNDEDGVPVYVQPAT